MTSTPEERLARARVLVEIGESFDAEVDAAEILEQRPDDLDALSLVAKIKHMRGELSSAMACWAQLYARTPLIETAQLQLRAILHLAMDPERGAGDYLALGPLQLAKKPVAHLELEQAFAQLVARRPEAARAACLQIAARYKGKDREVYKLAVLANAFIAELSGQLDEACRLLERLGSERGFETDIDRVLALARMYERLGTPDRLEAAAHICQYLENRFGTIHLLGRLASLYRRLGRTEESVEFERRHLEAFRRRRHRPSFLEVTEVAARSYLPLQRLLSIRFIDQELGSEATPRQRAVGHALSERLPDAEALFSEGGAVLDRKYLGDLAALRGDEESAIAHYLAALADEPPDSLLLSWLLASEARRESPPVVGYFLEPRNFERAQEVLDRALRAWPRRASLWRHLAALLSLDPDRRGEALGASERAAALEAAERRELNPVGRALAAAVLHFAGKAKGIIHEVWAAREVAELGRGGALPPSQILGNLSPEMRHAVQNTFLSVREYALSKFPHLTGDLLDYNYTFKITKEDEPSSGQSAGLPMALAFLSVMLQRTIPQDVASSGAIVADSHDVLMIRAVGETEHKVKAAYDRNLRMIVLPAGNRNELLSNSQVPVAIHDEIVRYAATLDDAVRLVFGDDVFLAPSGNFWPLGGLEGDRGSQKLVVGD